MYPKVENFNYGGGGGGVFVSPFFFMVCGEVWWLFFVWFSLFFCGPSFLGGLGGVGGWCFVGGFFFLCFSGCCFCFFFFFFLWLLGEVFFVLCFFCGGRGLGFFFLFFCVFFLWEFFAWDAYELIPHSLHGQATFSSCREVNSLEARVFCSDPPLPLSPLAPSDDLFPPSSHCSRHLSFLITRVLLLSLMAVGKKKP